jgi:GNAT superfamily N-acetyltransferase
VNMSKNLEETLMQSVRRKPPGPCRRTYRGAPGDRSIVAETGKFAAYLAAEIRGGAVRVAALEVRPEYCGLGIGEALLSRLADRVSPGSRIILDLPSEYGDFSRVLLRNSFTPYTTGYVRYLRRCDE